MAGWEGALLVLGGCNAAVRLRPQIACSRWAIMRQGGPLSSGGARDVDFVDLWLKLLHNGSVVPHGRMPSMNRTAYDASLAERRGTRLVKAEAGGLRGPAGGMGRHAASTACLSSARHGGRREGSARSGPQGPPSRARSHRRSPHARTARPCTRARTRWRMGGWLAG